MQGRDIQRGHIHRGGGGGHKNEVDTEASMIPRLRCKLGNPQHGEINFSEYEFLLFQLGTG